MSRAAALSSLLLAATAAAGCSRSEAMSASTPATPPALGERAAAAPATDRPRLIFFMNPNGRPCQMQEAILRGMPDLPARADVTYLRTTEPGDLARFDQFGIRSLPQLVVVDQHGMERRRATPGIQSEAQVRQLLQP